MTNQHPSNWYVPEPFKVDLTSIAPYVFEVHEFEDTFLPQPSAVIGIHHGMILINAFPAWGGKALMMYFGAEEAHRLGEIMIELANNLTKMEQDKDSKPDFDET